ncbi:hypothetical protein D9757_010911 [Collybiopsis confluens]|uniref:Uncharacterized protein n=1 Tax=Collybiopsis confluens TaxID=2823264 RepID=A0A8H5GI49_9AGAR|nr:hypothetical protein D9757_010911 [Collybiopsis confluens]
MDVLNGSKESPSTIPGLRMRPLSQKQERRLLTFVDNEFLELTRGYKKRSSPTSALQTLDNYLQAAQRILGLILQIPPVDPSTSLRIQLLLRLTNEILTCIPGYPPSSDNLSLAMDWLDDLDQSWVAVLQAQVWNPRERVGEDLVVDAQDVAMGGVKSTPMNQTERTRLKSLLLGGVATLEEWLEGKTVGGSKGPTLEALTTMDIDDGLNDIFSGTLQELGGFGVVALEPEELCPADSIEMEIDME